MMMQCSVFLAGFVVAVVVAVAVAIAVAVGVAVAVTALVVAGAVQNEGHVAVFLFIIQAVKIGEHRALEHAGADDEECAIHVFVDDLGIGNDFNGGAVDYHVVVLCLQLTHKLSESGRFKQLGGVRRN